MRASRLHFAAALPAALLFAACTSSTSSPPVSPSPSGTGSLRPVPNRSVPRWMRLADAPTKRLEVASAVVEGKLYVAGGLVPGGGSKAVEIFDPRAGTWSRGPDLPEAVHHAMGVALGRRFVVIGGFTAGGLTDATDKVWSLGGCPPGVRCPIGFGSGWWSMPSLRRPRAAGAAGVVGEAIVVAGGQAGGSLIRPTEVFESKAKLWRDAAPIPTPRDHLAGASDGSRFLYTAGGRKLSIDSVVPAAERFDVTAGAWEKLPGLPTPRGGFGGAFAGGRFVTIGGEGPRGTYDEVEAYDPVAREWDAFPRLTASRHAMGTGVIGGLVYVAGGGPEAGGSYSAITEVLDVG